MATFPEKLATDEFVVTTELTPPKGIDLDKLLNKAEFLAPFIDAFNLTDSHSSRMSLSPIAVASRLLDFGYEPILQITTRDRNRISLQSDMLGAAVLGIKNIVCMGGDPAHFGDHPDAKPVFDLSTTELINAAYQLSQGQDLAGNALQGTPTFNIGAVVNPGADDLDREISLLEDKVAAGAWFFQTQAIYDAGVFGDFMNRVSHLPIKIIAGILPIKSVKMAMYMNEKISGIQIPNHLMADIDSSKDVKSTSADIAAKTIRAIKDSCAGVHMMAIGAESQIPIILQQAA
jgi:5,10-methylenetetrahydrofolate reductase